MAATVHVAGACIVKIAVPYDSSLETLGYCRNNAEVTKEAFWQDVPGDENGGDEGPPIEVVYLGEIARIRLELTKWDTTVANKVRARLNGATAGTPATAGSLMLTGSYGMRLLLHSTNIPRNFPLCIPRSTIEIGRGTKYSSLICEFEAHKNSSGILYNSTTT